MSETDYYIRNWGRILLLLAICCAVDIFFYPITLIAKVILIAILLSNNKKFLYLIQDRNSIFKKYYRFLKGSCILFGISVLIYVIGFFFFQITAMYYFDLYGYANYVYWVQHYGKIVQFWFSLAQSGIMSSAFILEMIAWLNLKRVFSENLFEAQPYYRDHLKTGSKVLIWGALILMLAYLGSIGYSIWNVLYEEPYNGYFWGYDIYDYWFSPYYWLFWILTIIKFVGLILLCIGHAIIGSNFRNPYFAGRNDLVPLSMGVKFGIQPAIPEGNNRQTDYALNYCYYCGNKLRPEGRFCSNCGRTMSN